MGGESCVPSFVMIFCCRAPGVGRDLNKSVFSIVMMGKMLVGEVSRNPVRAGNHR